MDRWHIFINFCNFLGCARGCLFLLNSDINVNVRCLRDSCLKRGLFHNYTLSSVRLFTLSNPYRINNLVTKTETYLDSQLIFFFCSRLMFEIVRTIFPNLPRKQNYTVTTLKSISRMCFLLRNETGNKTFKVKSTNYCVSLEFITTSIFLVLYGLFTRKLFD